MGADERKIWAELKREVELLGTYSESDFTTFRLCVKCVTEALHPDPRDPATARVRVAQIAAGLLARFGLDPASRGRVSGRPPEKAQDDTEKLLFGGPLKVVNGGESA
jgi:hypothetical protein